QALLESVMRGMKTDLTSVRIEPGTASPGSLARPGKYALVVRSAATTTAGQILDDWYGQLIAAGYNQQCGAKADHCLAWYDTGHEVGRTGCCKARRPFANRAYLARRIRAALASVGLRAASISFEHPNAFAAVVTVR